MSLKEIIQNKRKEFDNQEISVQSDAVFARRLKSELHKPVKGKVIYLKYLSVAASLGILISLGVWALNNTKIQQDKKQLVANLTDTSAGARLEAIYHFDDEYKKEDRQIIEVLINILHDDSNVNVKIATIDALLKFPQNELIRTNLIQALGNEKTPLVQIKLIKSLSILRENRAQKPLKKLIESKETLPIVVNNASLAMAEINQNQ